MASCACPECGTSGREQEARSGNCAYRQVRDSETPSPAPVTGALPGQYASLCSRSSRVALRGLGSARVSRVGFGVAPKQSFLAQFIFLRPDPWIMLVLASHICIPWISQDVIKSFLFPNCTGFLLDLVDLMR